MVLKLQFRNRLWFKTLVFCTLVVPGAALSVFPARADAGAGSGLEALRSAQAFYQAGQYFKAARYAFHAKEIDSSLSPDAYAWVTLGLTRAHLYQSASYFFIRTLQSGSPSAIQRVLPVTQEVLLRVGADLLRKYLIRHTRYEDYDSINRSAYLYVLGRSAILAGENEKAIGYLSAIDSRSPLQAFALQLRGSAFAIAGKAEQALADFRYCASHSRSTITGDQLYRRQAESEAEDLEARCRAGEARTLYEMERFEDAERAYDRIPKVSMVWPDILFEQGWNSFARKEYNRTLGKLVSYKSPALRFVFNPEIEVLRAQTYLALCLYDDASQVVNEFNSRYERIGEQAKRFIEGNSSSLSAFYELGAQALRSSLYSDDGIHWMVNRFARGPYFKGLVSAEKTISSELDGIRRFNASQSGVSHEGGQGFPGFLNQVLQWRARSIRLLGGAFVKNSLLDHYAELLSNFDKMSFIKLEMLKRAKDRLLAPHRADSGDRSRGSVIPRRRDYQYYWSFNGEFWNDELGDYVFGLESECKGGEGA